MILKPWFACDEAEVLIAVLELLKFDRCLKDPADFGARRNSFLLSGQVVWVLEHTARKDDGAAWDLGVRGLAHPKPSGPCKQ